MNVPDHLSAHLARVAASPLPPGTKESAYNLPEDPMDTTTTVYGMPVELPDPPAGMIVADVVILARAVPVDGDRGRDALLAGVTDDTGGMVYRGILAAAADVVDVRDGDSDD